MSLNRRFFRKTWWNNYRRVPPFLHIFLDTASIVSAWGCAYLLRFSFQIPAPHIERLLQYLASVVGIQLFGLYFSRINSIIPSFVSARDVLTILKASIVAEAGTVIYFAMLNRFTGIPRSVPVIDLILLVMFLCAWRLAFRLKGELVVRRHGIPALIVGAGRAGEMLARDLLGQRDQEYFPVGFVDDDRSKLGKQIHGLKVLGRTRDMPEVVAEFGVEMVFLAIPSAGRRVIRRLVGICEDIGVQYRTLPSTNDLLTGRVTVSALREVTIEDLLGREPVRVDTEGLASFISGRTVMITGAGGSIGGELCRQIAMFSPRCLIGLDISEFNLYRAELYLRKRFPELTFLPALGDVRNAKHLRSLFALHRPEIVFHAAAYKHVPMVEMNPFPGVDVNIFGTKTLATVAAEYGVEKFIMISTDKAVNPTNVMGATKRVAELCCQAMSTRTETAFIITRFGNVLGSSGSVVPLFREQIAAGGPVTVTHPNVKRFFMTITEACQLVLQASLMGLGGEVFVLDMGEPVAIKELAEQLIRLSGLVPERDISISYVGLRPGEKLYEELFYRWEEPIATEHSKILLAQGRPTDWEWLSAHLSRLERLIYSGTSEELKRALSAIVPEYRTVRMVRDGKGKIFELQRSQKGS